MKAYVKPCITRREMGYIGIAKPMYRYANCIIEVRESGGIIPTNPPMYRYQQTGKANWYWDSRALIMLDTEEKYEKFKKIAVKEYQTYARSS